MSLFTIHNNIIIMPFTLRVGYARISHGGLSDTEVQVGKFRLPDYPGEPDNEVMTQSPGEVPQSTHFPKM